MKNFRKWIGSRSLKAKIQAATHVLQQLSEAFIEKPPIVNQLKPAQAYSASAWSDQNFIKWLKDRQVNVTLGETPKKYSDGGIGRAYFLGDKVIKFTDNRVEANVANMVANNPKTPTRIYGVYKFKPHPVWAILQKKVNMNDLPKMIAKASDILMSYVDETGISEFPEKEEEKAKMAQDAATMFEEPLEIVPFIVEIMDVLQNLYKNTGFFHDDAMPQNIGVDDGNIVIPDLGPNKTKDYNARKALDTIHHRRQKLGLPPIGEV